MEDSKNNGYSQVGAANARKLESGNSKGAFLFNIGRWKRVRKKCGAVRGAIGAIGAIRQGNFSCRVCATRGMGYEIGAINRDDFSCQICATRGAIGAIPQLAQCQIRVTQGAIGAIPQLARFIGIESALSLSVQV